MSELNHQLLAAELPRVLVFAAVARHCSFAAASQELNLSRSTVSHHVAALEKALGARLLERSTRTVRLTDAGRDVLETANAITGAWVDARARLEKARETPVGTLVVTAPDVIADRMMAPAIAEFVTRYPECDVDLRVTAENLDLLREQVDVAVRAGPLPDSSMGARLLFETKHVIMGAPQLAEAWPATTPADLAEAPFVDHRLRRRVTTLVCGEQSQTLAGHTRVTVDTGSSLTEMCVAGAGFGLLPEHLAAQEHAAGKLVRVCPGWSAAQPLTFHAVMPSPRPLSARVQRFVETLAERFSR